MTVTELIAHLSTLDPNAQVLVLDHGESRILHSADVVSTDAEDHETADGDNITGPVVHLTSWD